MKKKLTRYLRIIVLLALAALTIQGYVNLAMLHRRSCPELYAPGSSDYAWLTAVLAVLSFLLLPVMGCVGGKLTGHGAYLHILFLEIRWTNKLRIRRVKRMGLGYALLPPRTDGTSPYVLAMLSLPLMLLTLIGLCLALAALFWHTGPAQSLLFMPCLFVGFLLARLLPRRDGSDCITLLLNFRNKDKLRAWECAMRIGDALSDGKKLMDMPEEWFQTYPAEVADDLYVSNCIINGSSRLMRQGRFGEAYEMLRPLFDLVPAPENHMTIACALLNGAICEALEDLPPMCLSQLEHSSVRYMCPPHWEPRRRTAQYARALMLNHDEAEAAALLPAIEKDIAEDQTDGALIRRIQEKAGIAPKEAAP